MVARKIDITGWDQASLQNLLGQVMQEIQTEQAIDTIMESTDKAEWQQYYEAFGNRLGHKVQTGQKQEAGG